MWVWDFDWVQDHQRSQYGNSAGDTILVRSGTYTERISIKGGVGDAQRTILQAYSGDTALSAIIDGTGIDTTWGLVELPSNYITLDGFTIQNASTSNGLTVHVTGGYTTIQNCLIQNGGGTGIAGDFYSQNGQYFRIMNNTISNMDSGGTWIYENHNAGGSCNHILIQGTRSMISPCQQRPTPIVIRSEQPMVDAITSSLETIPFITAAITNLP